MEVQAGVYQQGVAMIQGFYTGTSGIYYNEEKLDVVSNNLANADTTGFRRKYLMLKTRDVTPQTRWMDPDVRKRNPSFYGVEREGVMSNYEPGRLQETENPMDLSISSDLVNGFFAVKRADPSDQTTYYTRNGSLGFAPENPSDPNSATVLQMSGQLALDKEGNFINIEPSAGALEINGSGEIYQSGEKIAELAVYRMNKSPDPNIQENSPLQAFMFVGDSLMKVPPGLKNQFNPIALEMGENGLNKVVVQGALEKSNINVINEMMEMMHTTKAAQGNASAMSVHAETLTKLFQLVRS